MDRKRARVWESFRRWWSGGDGDRPFASRDDDDAGRTVEGPMARVVAEPISAGIDPDPEAAEPMAGKDRVWTRAALDAAPVDGGVRVHGGLPTAAEATFEATIDSTGPFDEAELLDFLAADLDPVEADPAFRERLREDLWDRFVAGRERVD